MLSNSVMSPDGTRSLAKKRSGLSEGEEVRIPKVGTSACKRYFVSWNQIWGFYWFVVRMAEDLEVAQQVSHNRLVETATDEAERRRLAEDWKGRISPEDFLRHHEQFFLEVVLVRHVENYLHYLTGLLYQLFTGRPETLKSKETIEYEFVLAHDSMDELVTSMAEKKVESLSHESFEALNKYFVKTFKLTLIPEEEEMSLVTEAVETRNISVHNRCVIDRRYIKRTGADESRLGTVRQLSIDEVEQVADVLAGGVRRLDSSAREKYKVKSSPFDVSAELPSSAEDREVGRV